MAENKKGFLLYADYLEDFSGLNMEERGQLITTILEYVNDLNPEPEDRVVRAAWIPIKKQLKRDLEKYEDKRKKRSEAGKISAEKRRKEKIHNLTKSTSVKSVKQKPTKTNTDKNCLTNSTVKDSVSVSVNDIPKGNNPKPLPGDSQRYLNLFNSIRSKHLKNARGARTFSDKLLKKLRDRLLVFTWEEIEEAIENAFLRENHKESNFQYLTPEFFVRGDEHLEKFLLTEDKNSQTPKLKRLNKRAV